PRHLEGPRHAGRNRSSVRSARALWREFAGAARHGRGDPSRLGRILKLDRLWAPWRMTYIASARKKKKGREPCLFCKIAGGKPRAGNLVLALTPHALVMLNLYPYNVGHVMVAPRAHKGSLADLSAAESVEITSWLGRVEKALRREYRPD